MSESSGPCHELQRLMDCVQEHLIRIAELSRATADAVAQQNEKLTRELDEQVEREIGQKERALAALRQHRTDHGC